VRTVFFAETPGIALRFALDGQVYSIKPGRKAALKLSGTDGTNVQIVVLDDKDSLALWKSFWHGRERVFLTSSGMIIDGDTLKLTSSDPDDLKVSVYPAPATVTADGKKLDSKLDGIFERFTPVEPRKVTYDVKFKNIKPAGPVREIPLGKISTPVAVAPVDADFEQAAVWQIELPDGIDLSLDPILRLHYVGDVARIMLNGKFITDDFYNGRPFDIGLRRHAPDILNGKLQIVILPLQKDAPIYLAQEAKPDFGDSESVVALKRVEIIPRYYMQLD
jgi:hypothetical protein